MTLLLRCECRVKSGDVKLLILNPHHPQFFYRTSKQLHRYRPDGAVVTRDTSNVEISGSIPLLGSNEVNMIFGYFWKDCCYLEQDSCSNSSGPILVQAIFFLD